MQSHCNDSPKDVAVALNAPYQTVAMYMRRIRNGAFVKKRYPQKRYYAIYLKKTDELVCSGTAVECAEKLEISMSAFYSLVGRATTGKSQKWEVYVEPFHND